MLFPEVCILFDTRTRTDFYRDCYFRLKSELDGICHVVAVCHDREAATGMINDVILLNDDAIFGSTIYQKDISCGVVPGNGDLKLIAAIKYLDYRRFIRWEDDVHCFNPVRENVSRLIEFVKAYEFAASYITPYMANGWKWWETLIVPNVNADEKRKMTWGAFLPLMAFSAKFIHAYDALLQEGWAGHYEVTMASAAKYLGMECLDLSLPPFRFTSLSQFGVTDVQGIQAYCAPFVHPVKNHEARARVEHERDSVEFYELHY